MVGLLVMCEVCVVLIWCVVVMMVVMWDGSLGWFFSVCG